MFWVHLHVVTGEVRKAARVRRPFVQKSNGQANLTLCYHLGVHREFAVAESVGRRHRLSVRGPKVFCMSTPSESRAAVCPTAAEANTAIRRFVAGRTAWSSAELAELDRLWAAWREAVRMELAEAA